MIFNQIKIIFTSAILTISCQDYRPNESFNSLVNSCSSAERYAQTEIVKYVGREGTARAKQCLSNILTIPFNCRLMQAQARIADVFNNDYKYLYDPWGTNEALKTPERKACKEKIQNVANQCGSTAGFANDIYRNARSSGFNLSGC